MNIEVEAKVRVPHLDAVIDRLDELGAEPAHEWLEENIFLDQTDHRLSTTDCGLRVRIRRAADGDEDVRVTFKGPKSSGRVKSRREIELGVESADDALNLLAELGYHEVIRFEKRRRRYRFDGCQVELDEMPYLGSYVEVEGPEEAEVLAVRDQLGLEGLPLIRSSYVAMLREYLHEHGIAERRIKLAPAASTAS